VSPVRFGSSGYGLRFFHPQQPTFYVDCRLITTISSEYGL
jgi:hypothetical protein